MDLPKQLQRQGYRFVLLGKWNMWRRGRIPNHIDEEKDPEEYEELIEKKIWKPLGKAPFETGWQKKANYSFSDSKLMNHPHNIGIIGGYGQLRILDVDDKKKAEEFLQDLPETFTVKTGSGGYHFYFHSDYNTNHVLIDNIGEFRARNYQVVLPGCTHPCGNKYEVIRDIPIKRLDIADVKQILKPYLREENQKTVAVSQQNKPEDHSRSGREMLECIRLIGKGSSKEEVFSEMMYFDKWANPHHPSYREQTYKKALQYINQQNTEKNAEIIQLLDKEVREVKYLDIGESKDEWYYGIKIQNKEAIVTSSRRVLMNKRKYNTEKKSYEGANEVKYLINYDGYLSDIGTFWSNSSIRKYLQDPSKLSKKEIYDAIKDKLDYYMDFDKYQHSSTVQACWVMATYVYPLFYWFPHLLINAPSGSGKSKNGFILTQLSFRGMDLGASAGVTPAQIFRTIEGNRGTLFIDEFERMDSDAQRLVNQILNASATKDAYVIRTEQINRKWRSWKFPIFCPKIVCNITGINPTSLSRFIGFNLLKTTGAKGKRKPYRQKDKIAFAPIRDNLHILMLQNWKEIREIYESLNLDLSNRDEDNWLPVCSIAKWLGHDVFDEVIEFVKSYKDLVIETSDLTETLFLKILENVTEVEDWYSSKQMAEWMIDDLSMYKSPDRWIGRKLTEYKFKATHKAKGNCYLLSKKNIQNIIDRYFCTDKTSDTSNTSFNSDSSDTSQKNEVSEQSEVFLDGTSKDFDEKSEMINHRCHICGDTSCIAWDNTAQGKPICDSCKRQKEAQT